jgi:hypothetical protein
VLYTGRVDPASLVRAALHLSPQVESQNKDSRDTSVELRPFTFTDVQWEVDLRLADPQASGSLTVTARSDTNESISPVVIDATVKSAAAATKP